MENEPPHTKYKQEFKTGYRTNVNGETINLPEGKIGNEIKHKTLKGTKSTSDQKKKKRINQLINWTSLKPRSSVHENECARRVGEGKTQTVSERRNELEIETPRLEYRTTAKRTIHF